MLDCHTMFRTEKGCWVRGRWHSADLLPSDVPGLVPGQDLLQRGGGGHGVHAGSQELHLRILIRGEHIQSAVPVKTVSLSIHFQFVFRSIDLLYNKLLNVSIDRNCIEINGAYLSLYQVSSVQDCIKLHQNQKIDTTLASILRPL